MTTMTYKRWIGMKKKNTSTNSMMKVKGIPKTTPEFKIFDQNPVFFIYQRRSGRKNAGLIVYQNFSIIWPSFVTFRPFPDILPPLNSPSYIVPSLKYIFPRPSLTPF